MWYKGRESERAVTGTLGANTLSDQQTHLRKTVTKTEREQTVAPFQVQHFYLCVPPIKNS